MNDPEVSLHHKQPDASAYETVQLIGQDVQENSPVHDSLLCASKMEPDSFKQEANSMNDDAFQDSSAHSSKLESEPYGSEMDNLPNGEAQNLPTCSKKMEAESCMLETGMIHGSMAAEMITSEFVSRTEAAQFDPGVKDMNVEKTTIETTTREMIFTVGVSSAEAPLFDLEVNDITVEAVVDDTQLSDHAASAAIACNSLVMDPLSQIDILASSGEIPKINGVAISSSDHGHEIDCGLLSCTVTGSQSAETLKPLFIPSHSAVTELAPEAARNITDTMVDLHSSIEIDVNMGYPIDDTYVTDVHDIHNLERESYGTVAATVQYLNEDMSLLEQVYCAEQPVETEQQPVETQTPSSTMHKEVLDDLFADAGGFGKASVSTKKTLGGECDSTHGVLDDSKTDASISTELHEFKKEPMDRRDVGIDSAPDDSKMDTSVHSHVDESTREPGDRGDATTGSADVSESETKKEPEAGQNGSIKRMGDNSQTDAIVVTKACNFQKDGNSIGKRDDSMGNATAAAEADEESIEPREVVAARINMCAIVPAVERGIKDFLPQESDFHFSISDLVWGKVKSHPWWPGQIFDPSSASEEAIKRKKDEKYLVAYFGDSSFAWLEKSEVQPFFANFVELERQSSSMKNLVIAVNCALDEVCRRIQYSLSCSCISKAIRKRIKDAMIVGFGSRRRARVPDSSYSSFNVAALDPDKLLSYIKDSPFFPSAGLDKLEMTIVRAVIFSFHRSKGHKWLPDDMLHPEASENEEEILPPKEGNENVILTIEPALSKRLKHEDAPAFKQRKKDPEKVSDNLDVPLSKRKEKDPERVSDNQGAPVSKRKKKVPERISDNQDAPVFKQKRNTPEKVSDSRDAPVSKWKKKEAEGVSNNRGEPVSKRRRKEPEGDNQAKLLGGTGSVITEESPVRQDANKNLKVLDISVQGLKGEAVPFDITCDLTSPSSARRSLNVGECIRKIAGQLQSPTFSKKRGRPKKISKRKITKSDQDVIPVASEKVNRRKFGKKMKYASADEMLSHLGIAAQHPLKIHKFASMIVGFFTDYRDEVFHETCLLEKQKKSLDAIKTSQQCSSSTQTPQSMTDSYWTDMVVYDTKEAPGGSRLVPQVQGKCNAASVEDCKTCDLMKIEHLPATLILSFKDSDSLPSVSDLRNIFGQYGPLEQSKTKILEKTKRAKVVFQHKADAELAFSRAGKFGIFGPSLLSYQLRYSSPRNSQVASKKRRKGSPETKKECALMLQRSGMVESSTQSDIYLPANENNQRNGGVHPSIDCSVSTAQVQDGVNTDMEVPINLNLSAKVEFDNSQNGNTLIQEQHSQIENPAEPSIYLQPLEGSAGISSVIADFPANQMKEDCVDAEHQMGIQTELTLSTNVQPDNCSVQMSQQHQNTDCTTQFGQYHLPQEAYRQNGDAEPSHTESVSSVDQVQVRDCVETSCQIELPTVLTLSAKTQTGGSIVDNISRGGSDCVSASPAGDETEKHQTEQHGASEFMEGLLSGVDNNQGAPIPEENVSGREVKSQLFVEGVLDMDVQTHVNMGSTNASAEG